MYRHEGFAPDDLAAMASRFESILNEHDFPEWAASIEPDSAPGGLLRCLLHAQAADYGVHGIEVDARVAVFRSFYEGFLRLKRANWPEADALTVQHEVTRTELQHEHAVPIKEFVDETQAAFRVYYLGQE